MHPIKYQTPEVYEEINFNIEPIDGIITPGCCKQLTPDEIVEILNECK
jgi:hypothetical protein